MKRTIATAAIAGLSLSAMVVALASFRATAEPERAIAVPHADVSATREDSTESWPAPSAPFDETPISPVESAGAPLFP